MPVLGLLVLIPLIAAMIVAVMPDALAVPRRLLAVAASAAAAGIAVFLVVDFDRDEGALQYTESLDWAPAAGLAWRAGIDGISLWLVALTAGLFLLGITVAAHSARERPGLFLGLLLAAEAGLLGLFVVDDLVFFYVFWETMLIPFYFLIALWGGEGRRGAAITFVIYTMAGSLIMLVAILGTAFIAEDVTGQFTFQISALRGVAFSDAASTWLFAGFALAFAIKLPLFPFHGWLPRAYSAAPILVTALLAAVMSKAGVYGLLRVGVPVFPEGADRFALPLSILAVAGIIYGSLVAWRAPTMRLLVGYSSLAHLGFIVLGIMAFDIVGGQGAVLQMVNHGIVVAAAFAIVGAIARSTSGDGIDTVSGLAAGAPRLAAIFLIVAMASLAIPGSNSFVGEFFILTGAFAHHPWLVALATIGIVYAAVYMLRLYQSSMNGPARGANPRAAELRPREILVLAPIILAMLVIALWPAGIVGATEASVAKAISPAQEAAGRPAADILDPPVPNPPPEALPLPGDVVEEPTATPAEPAPEETP